MAILLFANGAAQVSQFTYFWCFKVPFIELGYGHKGAHFLLLFEISLKAPSFLYKVVLFS